LKKERKEVIITMIDTSDKAKQKRSNKKPSQFIFGFHIKSADDVRNEALSLLVKSGHYYIVPTSSSFSEIRNFQEERVKRVYKAVEMLDEGKSIKFQLDVVNMIWEKFYDMNIVHSVKDLIKVAFSNYFEGTMLNSRLYSVLLLVPYTNKCFSYCDICFSNEQLSIASVYPNIEEARDVRKYITFITSDSIQAVILSDKPYDAKNDKKLLDELKLIQYEYSEIILFPFSVVWDNERSFVLCKKCLQSSTLIQ